MTAKIFETEADLCKVFCDSVSAGGDWNVYAETAGFDILLAHKTFDWQIGIEAKLALNAKVLTQILPSRWSNNLVGPDFRAVLVPEGKATGLAPVCDYLGITVIQCRHETHIDQRATRYGVIPYRPVLPDPKFQYDISRDYGWFEWSPWQRCALPEYIPDVAAGLPSPRQLSEWKIKAIKLAILMESRAVHRSDFEHLKLSPSRWTAKWSGWLRKEPGVGWVPGSDMPDFKAQHPEPYARIAADFEKWKPKETA